MLSLVVAPGSNSPLGVAIPVGLIEHGAGPAVVFRLVIDKTEPPGRWVCIGRRFVPLGDAGAVL
jgi:hypothetical protein